MRDSHQKIAVYFSLSQKICIKLSLMERINWIK